jgi:hypothetical protein
MVGFHDVLTIEDVLNGVSGLILLNDGAGWDALFHCEGSHNVGLWKLIVGWATRKDDVRCDAGFELANAFERALPLLRRWRAVGVGGIAEDDDGVEVTEVGVVGGYGSINDSSSDDRNEAEDEDDSQKFP